MVATLTLALGCVVLAMGVAMLSHDLLTLGRYARLADELPPVTGPETQDGSTDDPGTASVSLPDAAAAWVSVQGTSINLPVADGSKGDTWYLTHDLWDNRSELGCPFMDPRCTSADGTHVLVYGHHLTLTGTMFSPLHHCFCQEDFNGLGTCTWRTRTGRTALQPLCALSVESHDQTIMRFSFSNETDLREWLGAVLSASSARSSAADVLLGQAHRVVTLVTCSSDLSGQPWRTLVLFVS